MLKQSPYWIDSNVEQSKKKLQEINLTPEIKRHVEHEKHPKSWFYTNIEKNPRSQNHVSLGRLNLLAHGKFHDYITWKAQTLGKVVVVEQDEAYTTQTCFECGVLNDIGSSKVYECKQCGQVTDRDIQSCFNILTRYMGSYSPPFA
jgi:hypothetical protein